MNRVRSLNKGTSRVDSSDQESVSDQDSGKARAVGRPLGYFRATHFKQRDELPKQHGRATVECIYCNDLMESCTDNLEDHIIEHCKKIPLEQRRDALSHVTATIKPTSSKRPATSLSRASMKRHRQQDVGQFLHGKLSRQQQTVINRSC